MFMRVKQRTKDQRTSSYTSREFQVPPRDGKLFESLSESKVGEESNTIQWLIPQRSAAAMLRVPCSRSEECTKAQRARETNPKTVELQTRLCCASYSIRAHLQRRSGGSAER